MDVQTLNYYARNAAQVAERYESIVNAMSDHFDRAFAAGGRVLDIGCGSGRDMAKLHAQGHEVYGVDATAEFVSLAEELHPELMGRIAICTLPEAPVPFGGGFDGVLCSAVLMHISVERQADAVEFIKRCLKPGGSLLYSIPSKRGDVVGDEHRDAAGRLFIPDTAGRLQSTFEAQGFKLIDKWGNADSLGRDGVEWLSVLMRLVSA